MVKEIGAIAKEASSLVFVNFHGLHVGEETTLRRDLREKKVGYKVFRKTLIKRALLDTATGELPELSGEVAIAYLSNRQAGLPADQESAKDLTVPPREIYNFSRAHAGLLNILGGIFDGKFVDGAFMTEIAQIPGREVLLSKIAFLLKSPLQRLALAVNEVAKKK